MSLQTSEGAVIVSSQWSRRRTQTEFHCWVPRLAGAGDVGGWGVGAVCKGSDRCHCQCALCKRQAEADFIPQPLATWNWRSLIAEGASGESILSGPFIDTSGTFPSSETLAVGALKTRGENVNRTPTGTFYTEQSPSEAEVL